MASNLQDRLYEVFTEAAGEQSRFPVKSSESFADGAEQGAAETGASVGRTLLEQVRETVVRSAVSSSGAQAQVNTSSVLSSVLNLIPASGAVTDVAKQVDGGGTAEAIATTVLKSAFGIVPMLSGLFGLFGGGGDQETPPTLTKYAMPAPIEFQAAETGGREIGSVDYDQMGRPRAYAPAGASGQNSGGPNGSANGAQITVNVNAMDARSFLDRSSDIAAAVREAMLNLNSINDVVNEL